MGSSVPEPNILADEPAEGYEDLLASIISIIEAATANGVSFPDSDEYEEPPVALSKWADRVAFDLARARIDARRAPDPRLVMLDQFWSIGAHIDDRIQVGDDLPLVLDALQAALGVAEGSLAFNRENLQYMRRFYRSWTDPLGWQHLAALSWWNIRLLLNAQLTREQRHELARTAIDGEWTDVDIVGAIKNAQAALSEIRSDLRKWRPRATALIETISRLSGLRAHALAIASNQPSRRQQAGTSHA